MNSTIDFGHFVFNGFSMKLNCWNNMFLYLTKVQPNFTSKHKINNYAILYFNPLWELMTLL